MFTSIFFALAARTISRINFPCIAEEAKNELTTEQVKQMFDNLPETIKKVNLIGGEPLLRKDILEILDHLHNKNMKVVISTNLTLLNEKRVKYLYDKGMLKDITFSISMVIASQPFPNS